MMTKHEILQLALRQSAEDFGCRPEDFFRPEPVILPAGPRPNGRKDLPLPFACDLVSYGSNVVAQTSPEAERAVRTYLSQVPAAHCFETPALYQLNDALAPIGLKVRYMAEYFLPDPAALREQPSPLPLRLPSPDDFAGLYPDWPNALAKARPELDRLAVGAFDHGRLVGLAGCSADGQDLWQIGVDVLPAFRRQGLASAMTARLALEILARGKVPFYCAAWCNLPSVRNALSCGFFPAWAQLTARVPEAHPVRPLLANREIG